MMDTRVPRKRKKVKRRRETVEFLAEGQQPQSRHGAEPQRQDTCNKSIPVLEASKLAPKHVPRSNRKEICPGIHTAAPGALLRASRQHRNPRDLLEMVPNPSKKLLKIKIAAGKCSLQ